MDYTLTEEQAHAVELFGKGENLVIEAGAGSGKTSTLVAIAESTDRRGNYHAFTKAIVVDSGKRMPPTVNARTMHSLAYGAIIGRNAQFKARLHSSDRLPRNVEASILDVGPFKVDSVKGPRTLAAGYLAGYVMEGITRFCHSADPEPTARHLPTIDFLDPPSGQYGSHRGPNNRALAEAHLIPLRRAWRDISNPEGRLRFSHDHYLKLYQLSDPTIAVDYILFDEAQDANPVMASILDGQAEWDTQLVYVGDSAQAIFGFTGAINAMERMEGNRTHLTKSFRFGQAVADLANELLAELDMDLRVVGNEAIHTAVGEIATPRAVVTRTNAKAIAEALDLMDAGRSVSIADSLKNTVTGFAKAAQQLQQTGQCFHRELAPFSSWEEVREFVREDLAGHELQLMVGLVDKFGVPTILSGLQRTTTERQADVVLSTAHTAKGREWTSVRLADDFPVPEPDESLPADELRLLYVAATRAIDALDVSQVARFNPGLMAEIHAAREARGL